MTKSLSPLRYPGGKAKIYDRVRTLIEVKGFGDKTYVEPFAGGFGIGIALLADGVIQRAMLNDYDKHLYHFWHSVMNDTETLLKMIRDTPITIEERVRQKAVFRDQNSSVTADGFATLFLNRVNFSGVLNGGPIGGRNQKGTYKVDCRFNKDDISGRIELAASFRERVEVLNEDGGKLIIRLSEESERDDFFNIDPPYVVKGNRLYTNYFKDQDHRDLGRIIEEQLGGIPWIVTYDDCELVRNIYHGYTMQEYGIQHNVGNCFTGRELVITNIDSDSFIWGGADVFLDSL
jgi:DNA adenine methylase